MLMFGSRISRHIYVSNSKALLFHSVCVSVNFFIIDWSYGVYIIITMSSVFEVCLVMQ